MFFLNCNQHFPMQVAICTIFTFILGNTSKKSAQRGFGFGIEFRRVEKSWECWLMDAGDGDSDKNKWNMCKIWWSLGLAWANVGLGDDK